MATTFIADAAKFSQPAQTNLRGGLSVNSGKYALAAALVINDLIRLCKIPANEVPVEVIFSCPDLDSNGSPAIVFDVGVYDSVGSTDDIDAFIDGSTVGQAGGVARMDQEDGPNLAAVGYDRYVQAKVITAPATGVATGNIRCTLLSRPAGIDD